MDLSTILILISIGLCAGIMSGFIGVGGGIVMVPALIFALGMNQHQAQGLSLITMLPPIGILAAMNYYKTQEIDLRYALILAGVFVAGAFLGSKLSLKMDANRVKLIFGIIMLYIAITMIWAAGKGLFDQHNQ